MIQGMIDKGFDYAKLHAIWDFMDMTDANFKAGRDVMIPGQSDPFYFCFKGTPDWATKADFEGAGNFKFLSQSKKAQQLL